MLNMNKLVQIIRETLKDCQLRNPVGFLSSFLFFIASTCITVMLHSAPCDETFTITTNKEIRK